MFTVIQETYVMYGSRPVILFTSVISRTLESIRNTRTLSWTRASLLRLYPHGRFQEK